MKNSRRIVMILLVAITVWSPFGALSRVHAQNPSNLVLGLVTEPPTTYFQTPANWGGFNTITQIPYLYMYTYGAAGVALPGVAKVPVPVPGTNDTKYIVNLRSPDMKWSDGVSMDSNDLAFSYGVFLKTGLYANLSSFDIWGALRDRVSSVSIVNSTAVEVDMFNPYPLFTMLSWLYQMYPYHYYKQFTGDNVLQTTSIIGGPGSTAYIPANYTAGSRTMVLVANPFSPSWNGATPTISKITIQFFTDESSLVNALAAGTVDGAMITPSDVQALSSVSSLKVDKLPKIYQMQFFIQPEGYPYDSRPFRQALMYLLPKDQVNSVLYNGQSATGNPLLLPPAAVQTYWPANAPDYKYNPTEAVNLLKVAGLVQNAAGKWAMPNGTLVTVDFEAPNNDPDVVRAAQMITTSMENVGLQVNLKIVDITTATNHKYSSPGDYKVILYADEYFPSPFKWMRNPVNLPFKWYNATFKEIYGAALQDTNPDSALAKLKQALTILVNEAVTNSVVFEPAYAAYNIQTFTNWQPALTKAADYQVFYNQMLAENVMTSVTPVAATTQTSVPTTTSVGPSPGADYTTITAAVVIVIIVGAIAAYMLRRRSKPQSSQ